MVGKSNPLKKLVGSVSLLIILTTSSMAIAEEVYLIRGFGNVFSYGVDTMVEKLNDKNINATLIRNGGEWRKYAADIVKRDKKNQVDYPIIVGGHSMGGLDSARFANYLAKHQIPVYLVVGIDPGFPPIPKIKANVRKVINFKLPSGRNYRTVDGANVVIKNVDLAKYRSGHSTLDDNPKVQNLIVNAIAKEL